MKFLKKIAGALPRNIEDKHTMKIAVFAIWALIVAPFSYITYTDYTFGMTPTLGSPQLQIGAGIVWGLLATLIALMAIYRARLIYGK